MDTFKLLFLNEVFFSHSEQKIIKMYQSKKTEILKTYTKRITTPLWNKCQNAGNIYEFIIGLLTCATNVDYVSIYLKSAQIITNDDLMRLSMNLIEKHFPLNKLFPRNTWFQSSDAKIRCLMCGLDLSNFHSEIN